jgi:hypothetical protein
MNLSASIPSDSILSLPKKLDMKSLEIFIVGCHPSILFRLVGTCTYCVFPKVQVDATLLLEIDVKV